MASASGGDAGMGRDGWVASSLQAPPPPQERTLGRGQRALCDRGNLFHRMAEHIGQDHRAALRRRQLPEGPQTRVHRPTALCIGGAGRRRARRRGAFVGHDGIAPAPA
jgi:hypothetical protein